MKWAYALLVTLILAGTALTGVGGWRTLNNWNALSWPSIEGRVVESGIRRSGRDFRPAIAYNYVVDGRPYTNSKFRLSWGHQLYSFESGATFAIRDFPAGGTVSVYYDPDDPAQSYLLKGLAYGNLVLLSLGVALIGLPLAFLSEFNAAANRRAATTRRARH